MNTVIFLGGEQGAGKSTAATYIKKVVKTKIDKIFIFKYADTIYQIHDLIEDRFSSIIGREALKKNGRLLQILGTEIGRNLYDKDIWIKATEKRILETFNSNEDSLIIVEDVRFENELDLGLKLKSLGIKTISIYLSASEEVRKSRVTSFRPDTGHQSEAELSKFKNKFQYTVSTEESEEISNPLISNILEVEGILNLPAEMLTKHVNNFNDTLNSWELATGHGANFEWRYDSKGKKRLHVKDTAPISALPKDQSALVVSEVEEIMKGLCGPGTDEKGS